MANTHTSQVRQNFHKDCEDAINKQINMELHASYVYMTMAYHFDRDDVALPGFFKYFSDCSDEERQHAQRLMKYMNQRGGRINLIDIQPSEKQEWHNPHEAMHCALDLEKKVNDSLLSLHSIASGHMDVNLCDFLETWYLQEQVDAIKEIADYCTNLKRVGDGLGVYIMDKELEKKEKDKLLKCYTLNTLLSSHNPPAYILHLVERIPIMLGKSYCTTDNPARHLYHCDCEKTVNEQIIAEMNASFAYLSMAAYFGRSEVALPGCFGYFFRMHEEELQHSYKLLRYQNMRGGKVCLSPIAENATNEWTVKKALEVSLEMEKLVKEKLMEVHDIAEKHHDLNLMDLIVTDFLVEQEKSIFEIGRLLHRFTAMEGCGTCSCIEYLFDKEMHQAFVCKASVPKDILLDEEKVYK